MYHLFGKSIQNDTLLNNVKSELIAAKQTSNRKLIVEKTLDLGDFYKISGLYTDAINQYNKALKILETEELIGTLYVDTNNKLGSAYLSLHNYNSAKNFIETAEKVATQLNYSRGKANAKALLGSTYEKQGNYLKAMQYEEESLALFKLLNDTTGMAKSFENIGSIYEDLLQFDKAYAYFMKSYEILQGKRNFDEANVLNNIGDVYRKKGNYKTAIAFTQKALEIAEYLNDASLLESANKDLSKVFALQNDFEKAYEYRVKSEEYKEIALINENTKQLNALQSVFNLDRKEAEIQLLKEKNKVSDVHRKLLLLVILSLISFAGIVFYVFRKKRRANQKIQAYKQQVLQVELEKKQAQEAEMQKNIKMKTASLSKYSLSLSQKNKTLADVALHLKNLSKRENINFKKKIKELAKEIEFNLKQDDEMNEFNELFNEIHPDFSKKLSDKAIAKLTSTEIKLAMLVRLNLSSKEIASILKVTPDSVRVARHRLRKKLPINSKKELVNFMLEI